MWLLENIWDAFEGGNFRNIKRIQKGGLECKKDLMDIGLLPFLHMGKVATEQKSVCNCDDDQQH